MTPIILTIPLEKGANQFFSSTWPEGRNTDKLIPIPSTPFPIFFSYHSTSFYSSANPLASTGVGRCSRSGTGFPVTNDEPPFSNISSTNWEGSKKIFDIVNKF